jgi:predicted transcriptional regulator
MSKLLQFADLGETRVREIKDQLKMGDSKLLQTYINQVLRYIQQTQVHYETLSAAWEELMSHLNTTISHCASKKREAKTLQTTARVVGGATTVAGLGAVGAGVTLSVIVGVFTFGIGTIVGLSVTAGVAVVGGVATAATSGATTTYLAEVYFKKALKTFESIYKDLKELQAEARKLEFYTSELNESMKIISDDTTNVNKSVSEAEYKLICEVLDALLTEVRDQQKCL